MNFIDMYKKIAEIDRAAPMYERVVGDQPTPPGINRLTGKPNEPEAPTATPVMRPAASASDSPFAHFSDDYLMKAVTAMQNGVRLRLLVSGPDAQTELKRRGVAVPSNETIEEPLDEVAQLRKDLGLDLLSESLMDECGDMPMPGAMAHSNQADSVTMNISMNGSGKGGIKDLMDILKNIDGESNDDSAEIVIGSDIEGMEHPFDEVYANEPDTETQPIDAVIPTGDDMHSKGGEALKVNGGGNPMAMESLKSQLDRLYQEIKESHQEKTTMKHIKNPTAGEKKAGKDIKEGTAGYKDRVDMLKSAEKDGRLKD
jgi:hypothetical protein